MRRLAAIGMTSALLAASACSGEADSQKGIEFKGERGILVEAQHQEVVRTKPNAINDPKAITGALKVGEQALAICYFKSATLGSDSVKIDGEGENADGFVFLWQYVDGSTEHTFGQDPTDQLRISLDECTTAETSGVVG